MKKESNRKIKIEITILIVVLIGIFALLSFFIKDELVARFSLWGTLIFGCGSIIVAISSLFVSIVALDNTKKEKNERIANEAKNFIIDHEKEIDYIPFCLIARACNNHHLYVRKIYNDFNKLTKETQKEILKQLNYDFELINDNNWIDKEIKNVRDFIEKNDIGQDFLYEGAKYFHCALKYSSEEFDARCEHEPCMPDFFIGIKRSFL